MTRLNRREFLSTSKTTTVGMALASASGLAASESASANQPAQGPATLPTIRLGEHQVSRLVAGWNPCSGNSYMGPFMDQHMNEYFTDERTVGFLQDCEKAGINTWQFSFREKGINAVRALRESGSKMKFICLHATTSKSAPSIKEVIAATGPFAIVHHGGVTDKMFRVGKSQEVHDFVKRAHDAGVLAGVSAHNPDCIKQVADEGWEVDLFMTCFYYLTRTPEDLKEIMSETLLKIGHYPFFADDPKRMTDVVRQVKQPCLGFKILAAGRKCRRPQFVRQAFQFAFENIKPIDGVIVGMYPRFHDQVSENAQFTRELGRT